LDEADTKKEVFDEFEHVATRRWRIGWWRADNGTFGSMESLCA